jgi:hypothetical protein
MFRRQLNALIEMLRAQLSAIQIAIQEQNQAAREASNRSRRDEEQDRPRRIAELHAVEHETQEASAHRKKEYRQQKILNFFTFFIAGGTVAAALGAIVYANLLSQQMDRERKTELSVNRPAVAPGSINLSLHSDKSYTVRSSWINYGNSPTDHLVISWTWQAQKPVPGQISFSSHKRALVRGSSTDDQIAIPTGKLQQFATEKSGFYVVGIISYFDLYPERGFHLVEYCSRLSEIEPVSKHDATLTARRGDICYDTSRTLNCLDEECHDYDQQERNARRELAQGTR